MQESVVADALQPARQDVLDDEPEEIRPREGPGVHLLGGGVDIAKSHLAVAVLDDVVFGDDALVEVA